MVHRLDPRQNYDPAVLRRSRSTDTEDDDERGRILLQLIGQLRRTNERIDALEERVASLQRSVVHEVDAQDVLELRLHSARLAAELSRVTVELRAEIDEVAQQRDREPLPEHHQEHAEDEPVVDLTERRARRSSGWLPLDS